MKLKLLKKKINYRNIPLYTLGLGVLLIVIGLTLLAFTLNILFGILMLGLLVTTISVIAITWLF